jgi:periplasmic protein TonB
MFEQSLMEVSSETRKRKRLTAVLSYSLEALVVVTVMAFPLVRTDALPLDEHPTFHAPTHYVPEHVQVIATQPPPRSPHTQQVPINPYLAPRSIPTTVDMRPDPTPPPVDAGPPCVGCIPVGPGEGVPGGLPLEAVLRPTAPPPVHHASGPVTRPSHSQESLLIRQVKPIYPPIAIQTRTQGAVVIRAIIDREGTIQHLQVVSGHPLLIKAALDAVQQWRYRAYLLNGEPVEVETQITVNFTLSGN